MKRGEAMGYYITDKSISRIIIYEEVEVYGEFFKKIDKCEKDYNNNHP